MSLLLIHPQESQSLAASQLHLGLKYKSQGFPFQLLLSYTYRAVYTLQSYLQKFTPQSLQFFSTLLFGWFHTRTKR